MHETLSLCARPLGSILAKDGNREAHNLVSSLTSNDLFGVLVALHTVMIAACWE